MSRIYLDHAATTPVRDAALEAFIAQAKRPGNASALHTAGRSVKLQVADARDRLAATLDADPTEIIFTAGGTESDNLAIKGLYLAARAADPKRNVIIATGIEHPAVADSLEWLATHEGAEDRKSVVVGKECGARRGRRDHSETTSDRQA